MTGTDTFVRAPEDRPTTTKILRRAIVVVITTALALWVLAALLDGFDIDNPGHALLAGLVVGVVNGVVWPLLSIVVVPISVLTLGIGAIVLDALLVLLVLDELPGVTVDGFGTAVVIVIGLAVINAMVSSLMAIDDDVWFDRRTATVARRRAKSAARTDVPGIVFVQLDGVAHDVLVRATRSGDCPTIDGWLRDGRHRLVRWETGWSSQTGVSQCGILHGSVDDMPAFRWVDKASGQVVVSNRPQSAAGIERAHSDGDGLLAVNGSSYNNLFSGDAARAVLTMSGIARRKEGRLGAGYVGYFSRPGQATRTLISLVHDVARERRAAQLQVRRNVVPRVSRSWSYALLRGFTTVISRDVSVQGVINDVAEGRTAIYVDLLGYDEVSHHSGPERADALAVLRDIDRQLGRIDRALHVGAAPVPPRRAVRPRPDPGRAVPRARRRDARRHRQPAVRRRPLRRRGRRAGQDRVDGVAAPGRGRPTATTNQSPQDVPTVLGSGSLGLVSPAGVAPSVAAPRDRRALPRPRPGPACAPPHRVHPGRRRGRLVGARRGRRAQPRHRRGHR